MVPRLLTSRWFVVLVAGLLALVASPSPLFPQFARPGMIAWTQCLDGKVDSYINAAVVGTDSAVVILRHEEVHRRQATDSTGQCVYAGTPAQLLNIEIEAYCASDSVEVRVRKRDPVEVSAQTLLRLMQQFHLALPVFTISDSWAQGCPGRTNRRGQ